MNRKKLVVGLAGGAAALSLIGAGVGASFTDAASASQSATTGSISLVVNDLTDGSSGKSVTFQPALNNLGSNGGSATKQVSLTNNGTLPEKISSLDVATFGNLPMTVGVAYLSPNPLNPGSNDVSGNNIILDPGHTSQEFTVTVTVPPTNNQGASGLLTLTVNGAEVS